MKEKLHRLMYGLYYPAVAGTGLVLVMLRGTYHSDWHARIADPAIQLGILFLLLFSASFMNWCEPKLYGAMAFIFDTIEVGLMFGGLFFLHLFDTSLVAPNASAAYVIFAVAISLQCFWRFFVGFRWHRLWGLRLLAVGALIAGWVLENRYSWIHAAVILVVAVAVGFYIFLPKSNKDSNEA
jgi:hypothetical protein